MTRPRRAGTESPRARAAPEDGAANAALEALIAKWLGLARRDVALAAGHKSRIQQLAISGDPDALEARLLAASRAHSRRSALSTSSCEAPDIAVRRHRKESAHDGADHRRQGGRGRRARRRGARRRGMKPAHGLVPGLAVVLVGEDPASQVYVRNKAKQTAECGMALVRAQAAGDDAEADLLALVDRLNRRRRRPRHSRAIAAAEAHRREARCSRRSTRRRMSTAFIR